MLSGTHMASIFWRNWRSFTLKIHLKSGQLEKPHRIQCTTNSYSEKVDGTCVFKSLLIRFLYVKLVHEVKYRVFIYVDLEYNVDCNEMILMNLLKDRFF